MEWNDCADKYPDWNDSGKRIKARLRDGKEIEGLLSAGDFGFNGEDEYPIFSVILNSGQQISFADVDAWKDI
jgi:hypothetical protein